MPERFLPTRILLVEDNPDDVAIFERALKLARMNHELFVARDGQEALEFLFHKGIYADPAQPAPDLILLDLNLPRVSGFDVLRAVRNSATYTATPVIILTSSANDKDIERGYRLGANTYIQKQANLVEALQALGEYWGIFARFPRVA